MGLFRSDHGPENLMRISRLFRQIWSTSKYVGIEVLTTVALKSNNFWYMTPCSPLRVN
jgi:hypothetical protein